MVSRIVCEFSRVDLIRMRHGLELLARAVRDEQAEHPGLATFRSQQVALEIAQLQGVLFQLIRALPGPAPLGGPTGQAD